MAKVCKAGEVWNERLGKCVEEGTLDALAGQKLERKRCGPGKFEGNYNCDLAKAFHNATMEGGQDEETGTVEEAGWFGIFRDLTDLDIREDDTPIVGAIVSEDNFGFFDYTTYDNKEELEKAWNKIEEEQREFYEEGEEAEED